ncbi:carbohydrate ABC transporter permease [Paenibacillus macerans]|uniref:carbohydrate ABC transporter permease n=1 Tax=Paenibacillus macerans TaxID=44252 RepID=UPI003D311D21
MNHRSVSYRIFLTVNYLFLLILSLLCIAPLVHVLAVSFSGSGPATANIVKFWPVGFTLEAYSKTLDNPNFSQALLISTERVVLGTALSMAITFPAAYALSKDNSAFMGRSAYAWFFVFTMLFNGGLVPWYIVIQKLHLINSIWALLLPAALNVWNLILMMNFFRGVPRELEEAALIDGANHFRTLLSIYLPVSLPAIATISLFTLVYHWNSWFDGLVLINDYRKYPLATFLQTIIVQQDFSKAGVDPSELANISERTVKAAQIFISAIPILLVYPFLQRYFVKGMVLGAVKE